MGIKGRVFCELGNGYFGVVPEDTVPGDMIAVVRGSILSIVVRKMDEETKKGIEGLESKIGWRLIGTAYVQGIMDGEVRVVCERGELVEDEIFWYEQAILGARWFWFWRINVFVR